jgi:[acyl-carrier-protein] S-malonyltransferase
MNNAEKIAVLFPGQGSQYLGMGKDFLETGSRAREMMDQAEKISGLPLARLCLEGPMEELTRALHLQPALTVINLICWQALADSGLKVSSVAGHSLGEYSALCASGILSFEETMRLVTVRGRLMEREGRANPGGMRAVIGLTLSQVQEILADLSPELGGLAIGNYNSEKQVVLSGALAALDAAAVQVKARHGKIIPLNVSIANHSPLVAGAVADFSREMEKVDFHPPAIPLLFNATGKEETEPDEVRRIMARQIASTVRWYEIMNRLLEQEVRIFIEVGPKTVLSGLLKKIVPPGYQYQSFQFDSPRLLNEFLDGKR